MRAFYFVIWCANAFLLVINLALAAGWQPSLETVGTQLNLDNEQVIAAWYPSVLFLLLGLAAIRHHVRSCNAPGSQVRPVSLGWLLFSILAFGFSADEVACLHENVEKAIAARVGEYVLGLGTNWTLPLAPVIIAAFGFVVLFCRSAFGGTHWPSRLAAAAVLCWAGAVTLEFVQCSLLAGTQTSAAWRAFEQPLEEFLELAGTSLMIMALIELGFEEGRGGTPCRAAPGP